MRFSLLLCLLPFGAQALQTTDLSKLRALYHTAPEVKTDAKALDQLMENVDTISAAPVLLCYKGANEMIQAKYVLNPLSKLAKFNKGKAFIQTAISRDTLNVEMRFIRFSIQNNLPAFLAYHEDQDGDRRFLLGHTKASNDPELRMMIFNYFSTLTVITPEQLKQLKN